MQPTMFNNQTGSAEPAASVKDGHDVLERITVSYSGRITNSTLSKKNLADILGQIRSSVYL